MHPKQIVGSLVLYLTSFALVGCVWAQDEENNAVLRVGVKPAAPFVMVDERTGKISGFSIDLINAIASQITPPRDIEFTVHANIAEHLKAVSAGEVDLGIAATSITSERESALEFSVPFYRGGLAIVTRSEGSSWRIWDGLASAEFRFLLFWLLLFLLCCAHVIWFTEKGQKNTFDDRWIVGVGQAMWWTIVTMSTVGYGDFVPRKPLSRLLGILIIVTGIVLFGVAIGVFSSSLTIKRLQSDIRTPSDLEGKTVAVVRNSIAERTLRRRGIHVLRRESVDDILIAVETGVAVAGVHDVALLRYHVARSAPNLDMVGPTFVEHDYAITFPIRNDIRKEVNLALLEIMESDPSRYRLMLDEWFETP